MRRTIVGTVFLCLVVSQVAWAAGGVGSYNWLDKLRRGAINIVTSPVEVARDIHNTTQEKNLLVGWTVGLLQGLGEGVVRFGAGVIEVLTCPFNFPDSRKAPILDPEYVWMKPGPKYI